MCGIHNCFDGVEICIAHIGSVQPSTIPLERPGTICRNLGIRTNVASKIRSLEHFDAQILLHLAHDLYRIIELEVCVLCNLSATFTFMYIYPLASRPFHSPSPFPSLLFLYAPLLPAFPPRPTGLGQLTLFRCTFMLPLASIVAVSPRNDTTLPRMRTV